MGRHVGIRGDRVVVVSTTPFQSAGMRVVPSTSELLVPPPPRKVPLKELKVAFVGNWKMACGISTYSEKLWPHVLEGVGHGRLFVEKIDDPTGPMNVVGNRTLSDEDIVQCWRRGQNLDELVKEIEKYDPDIVWVQHEFGLWSNACHWLSFVHRMAKRRLIVTMHSVFHHRDKTICEAIIPEIVVHLDGAKKVLKQQKKISSNVTVIPHGCDPCTDTKKLWNLYRSPRTFLQAGFGFRYKGWETSLEVARILAERHSDVFFTGLFSEGPFSKAEHDLCYDDLMSFVEKHNLQSNVAIIRGYQSDEVMDSYMRTNQAVLFPYVSNPKHEVFGASGAARLAMSKAVPVVTTSVNHFSDLPTLKGDTPQELATILDNVFSDPIFRKRQVDKQLKFVEENSWERVALSYLELFER